MNAFHRIAEARIAEAIAEGRFDDLALAGQPLDTSAWERVPPELRGAYTVLKSGGFLPEEMELKKELVTLRGLLAACRDPRERGQLEARVQSKQLCFEILMDRRRRTLATGDYRAQVLRRLR